MVAAHHFLFALEESDPFEQIDNWMDPFLFQIGMSVHSLQMFLKTFLCQYNAPRLLHSTADYGCQSYFENFGVLLDVDQGYR